MSNRQLTQKVVNTFVRGLITERGELTFPPDASVDELNCDLRREGFRRRREAVAIETSNSLSTFTTATSDLIWNGTWLNVGGVNDKEYEVVQVGSKLYFYDKVDAPFSGSEVTGQNVDLSAFEFAGSEGVGNFRCQFASLNGLCVVANPAMDTVFLKEDATTGNITATKIDIFTRDFLYLSDRQELLEELSPDSAADEKRKYDTYNSGWVGEKGDAALNSYIAAEGAYPALNLPWFSGKDANGNFSVASWNQIQAGSTLMGNGHFILDFFNKNRNVKGLTTIAPDTEPSRFQTVAAFSGRIFYAGLRSSLNSGTILFSRQLDALSNSTSVDSSGLGECYQVNDPTSEELSDVLDTDGGSIRIQEAYNIRKLHVFNNSLFIFAENGVWQIKGIDDVFRATSFSVAKLTGVGIDGEQSFCSANGIPFWWSEFGIHTIGFDQQSFQAAENNISIDTIQTFFDAIDLDKRREVISRYDPINQRIFWMYPSDGETVKSKYNKVLVLDIPLQAFYPWTISDQASNTNYVVGMIYYTGIGSTQETFDVFSAGDDVTTSAGDDVVSDQVGGFDTGSPAIVLLVRDGTTGSLTMAQFNGEDFLDWGDANYSSFAEAGHDFMGSMSLKKNVLVLDVKCRVTEEGFTGNETDGYEAIRPSSVIVKSFWDFATTAANSQQGYRLKGPIVVDSNDLATFPYPETVVSTKLKIRGKGESVRLRFESEQGKDFVLLGFGYVVASNTGL